MSSPVIQTAPLEVGRSSSQSALSERPGRWNGRVERGAGPQWPSCPAELFPVRGLGVLVIRPAVQSLPREPPLVGLRGGRLSPQADLSYEPPSPRDARPVHLGPSPSVHRPTRLTRPLAGAGSQASPPGRRASSGRGAGARDLLSKPACRRMHGRSETFPAVGMAALPPLTGPRTGSRRWRRRGRSRRRSGSRRSCGGRRSRRAAGRRNASGGRAEARSFSPSSGSSHGSTSTSGGLPVVPPTRSKYSAFVLPSHSFHVAAISPCSFLSLSCAARSSSKSEPGALLTSRSRKGACRWRMGPATSAHVPIHAGSRMSTALVRPMPPILTGRRACLRARSQRLPAAPTRAPPTSLYSAASISSSCLSLPA